MARRPKGGKQPPPNPENQADPAASASAPAQPKRGRPTGCTPELTRTIASDIEAGASPEDAATNAGLGRSTFYAWKAKGEAGEQPFLDFLDAVTRAEASFKVESIGIVADGRLVNGRRDWRARMTLLERRYPDEYAPQQAVNVKLTKELEVALDKLKAVLPADAYDLALRALAGGDGGGPPPGETG